MAYDFPNSPAYGDTYDKYKWDGEKWCLTIGGRPLAQPHSSEAVAFLARTSGLDTTHTNAYYALIDGLVADSLWSKFDVLYIYATNSSANALLNLVSSSYNGTPVGSPGFTADRGMNGADGSSFNYIDTNFNPSTASSPKSVLNSAHISLWTNATVSGNGSGIIATSVAFVAANHNSGAHYVRINSANSGGGFAVAASAGHYLGCRISSSTVIGYRNASVIISDATASSTSVPNFNYYSLAYNSAGTPVGCSQQHSMFSIGSSLDATQAANFYSRLRTYMTAVGVP